MTQATFDGEAAADLDADSGGILADLLLKINVGIGSLNKKLAAAEQREAIRLANLPNYTVLSRSTLNNAATSTLVFGGPQPGRQWVVNLLSAGPTSLAANAAAISWFVGQPVLGGLSAGIPPMSQFVYQMPSTPSTQAFTSQVLRVMPNEQLFVVVTNDPQTAPIVINARVQDMPVWNARIPVSDV